MSDFKTAMKNIQAKLEEAILKATRPDSMEGYAKFLAEEIKLRTRLGYGVASFGANKKKLPRLKKSTIRQREARRYKDEENKKNKEKTDNSNDLLSEKTNPSFSNLTQTAQLLDALDGRSTQTGKAEVFLHDQRRGETLTNTKLAKHLEDQGRVFMNVSKQELKRLTDKIRKDLIASVRKG